MIKIRNKGRNRKDMLFVIDVGNTNIKLGVWSKDKLVASWRIKTEQKNTADEYMLKVDALLRRDGLEVKDITGVIMSSVIPSLNYTLEHMCEYEFGMKPMIVGPGIKTSLNIKYDNPREVGSDRIVNSVAAYKLYGGPCIVIDFGTTTTFNAVSEKGEFLGGAIAPGIKASVDAMINNAARLPRIELFKPEKVIGKNTVSNMQSGVIFGFTGMVKYIVQQMKKELKDPNAKVIATGGMSQLVFSEERIFDVTDRTLTLRGLKMIYDYNIGSEQSV